MTPSDFLSTIRSGKFAPLYLLTGPEIYFHQECLRELVATLLPDETLQMMNFSEHSATEQTLGAVLGIAGQFPLMAKHRVVVVRNFEKASDAEIDALKNYIRRPNPTTILIFQAPELDKRRTIATILQKGCTVVECKSLTDQEITAWAQQYVRRQGFQFSPPALGQFVGLVGNDLQTLTNELVKLMTYVGKGGTINPPDVEAVTVRSREFGSFDLGDAIVAGDVKKAVKILHRLLDQGEEPVALVGMLAWVYRSMLTAWDLMQKDTPRDEIIRELRMPPYKVTAFLTGVRKKSGEALRRGLVRLAEVDVALKSSRATPRLQIEMLVCELLLKD
ncbi:MAG: DNA polymerase III subunit delta [Blastocatellia bacterium]|nr:DNA polymerase III subunit delta [Blastocatellia bacterium]